MPSNLVLQGNYEIDEGGIIFKKQAKNWIPIWKIGQDFDIGDFDLKLPIFFPKANKLKKFQIFHLIRQINEDMSIQFPPFRSSEQDYPLQHSRVHNFQKQKWL